MPRKDAEAKRKAAAAPLCAPSPLTDEAVAAHRALFEASLKHALDKADGKRDSTNYKMMRTARYEHILNVLNSIKRGGEAAKPPADQMQVWRCDANGRLNGHCHSNVRAVVLLPCA